jgi:cystathionine beta-lyase/cystathionine gamma-synthase
VLDLGVPSQVAREFGLVMVDATFASPVNFRPSSTAPTS